VNTRQNPDRIVPRPLTSVRTEGEKLEAVLAPASWNVIQVAVSD
jgi:alpha-L-arabinofuranosidase